MQNMLFKVYGGKECINLGGAIGKLQIKGSYGCMMHIKLKQSKQTNFAY